MSWRRALRGGCAAVLMLWGALANGAAAAPRGLAGRTFAGYQGWYGCPGDFEDNRHWQHWFLGPVAADALTVDLLPDTSGMAEADLCDTGLARADGRGTVKLFSSLNPAVVRGHLAAAQRAGIDGVALQRFVAGLDDPRKQRRMDQVLRNVLAAAERTGRLVYLVYDVSGAAPATVARRIDEDWRRLQAEFKLRDSRVYLREQGRPVLQLWGFGFQDRPGEPAEVAALLAQLRRDGAYLVGGVPSHWRTLSGDSRSDPAWAAVYRSYDVISPWHVGRFRDAAGADAFLAATMRPDRAETARLGLRYMPVVFAGFSWSNLMRHRGVSAELNQIPRACGRFLARQLDNAAGLGVDALYAAMLDEFDEATALLPAEAVPGRTPQGAATLAPQEQACQRAPAHYLQQLGEAARRLDSGAARPPTIPPNLP